MHSLLKTLVLFQFDGQGEKLQQAYEEALQLMEAAIPEVWQEGLQQSQTPVSENKFLMAEKFIDWNLLFLKRAVRFALICSALEITQTKSGLNATSWRL